MDIKKPQTLLTVCLSIMVLTYACWSATPASYYQKTFTQLKTDAQAYLSSAGKAAQPYAVGIAPKLSRIYRDGGPALTWTGPITLSAAKGETEHCELAIVPVQAGLTLSNIQLSVTDIKNSEGYKLGGVKCGPMGYVSTNSVTHIGTTFEVPDVMGFGMNGFRTDPNELQAVILAVDVPAETPSGLYTGSFTIAPQGTAAETFAVQITVYNFELPYGPAIKTQFSSTMTSLLHDNRVESCWWDPTFTNLSNITQADWDATAASVQSFFAIPGNTFMIIRTPGAYQNGNLVGGFGEDISKFNSYTATDIQNMKTFWAGMATILAAQGRLSQACLYVWDEPGPIAITKVDDVCTWVHDADSRLKTLCTDNNNNVRALRQSGLVNIHIPLNSIFNPSLDTPSHLAAGTEAWIYVCIIPASPWPNVMADNSSVDNRVLPWQIAQQGITGLLYWDTQASFWESRFGTNFPGMDCGSMSNGGDGTLIHAPGGGRWFPSLRLRNLADGMEDYLYIKELEHQMERSDPALHNVPNNATWQSARNAGTAALNQVVTVAGTAMNNATTSPTTLLNARDALAQAIVTLKNLLGPETCGGEGQHYFGSDITGPDGVPDCQVNMMDFALLAGQWTQCTDPCDVDCAENIPQY